MFRSSLRREASGLTGFGSSVDLGGLVDSFSVLSSYVSRQDGGSPTWYVGTGGLIVVNPAGSGSQGTFVQTSLYSADGYAETTIVQAQDAGLVGRLTDQNNFYLLALSDDSGTNPSANLRLFKRVAGTFTQLGSSVDAAWTRGTQKTFRLQCVGTTISALMDGVPQISVTDSALAGPGYFGMRSNSGTAGDVFMSFKRGPA